MMFSKKVLILALAINALFLSSFAQAKKKPNKPSKKPNKQTNTSNKPSNIISNKPSNIISNNPSNKISNKPSNKPSKKPNNDKNKRDFIIISPNSSQIFIPALSIQGSQFIVNGSVHAKNDIEVDAAGEIVGSIPKALEGNIYNQQCTAMEGSSSGVIL